jgi:ATP-dependent Lon protease
VLLLKDNEKDLKDISKHVRDAIQFILVGSVDEVLDAAMPDTAVSRETSRVPRNAVTTT